MKEPFFLRRSTITLGVLGFLLVAIAVTFRLSQQSQELRQRAAPETTLSLSPASTTVVEGDQVVITVDIDTGANLVTAADLTLNYDPTYLEEVSITPGSFLPVVLSQPVIGGGQAHLTVGSTASEPKTGQGTLATLTFRALAPSASTQVSFSNETQAASIGETGNVVVSLLPANITIGSYVPTAQADTVLQLRPQVSTVKVGDEFSVSSYMITNSNIVTAADLVIDYDASRLEVVSFTAGSFLPTVLRQVAFGNGQATLTLGASPTEPKQGEGELGVLTFRAVSSGSTYVQYNSSTAVAALNGGDQNVVRSSGNWAFDIGSASTSNSTTVTDPCNNQQPAIPSGLTATGISTNQIHLSWQTVQNATHYGIVYGSASNSYNYGAANVGNVNGYTVGNLAENKNYYFKIFAVNDCGTRGYSGEASARTFSSVGGAPIVYATPTPGTRNVSPTPKISPIADKGFVPLDPSSSEEETIPFLTQNSQGTSLPVVPKVSIPPQTTKPNPGLGGLLTPIGGVLLIIASIFVTFFFFRLRSN